MMVLKLLARSPKVNVCKVGQHKNGKTNLGDDVIGRHRDTSYHGVISIFQIFQKKILVSIFIGQMMILVPDIVCSSMIGKNNF